MAIDLREFLGDSYHDGMTIEEMNEALGNSLVSRSDYDAMSKKADKFSKEAGDNRKKLKAYQTDEENKAQETQELISALQSENASLKKEKTVAEYTSQFAQQGYDNDLAVATATALADGDMATVFKNQGIFNQNQIKKFQSEQLAKTVVPDNTDDTAVRVSKKDLSKMTLAEVSQFAKDHPEEYHKIYK